MNSRRFFVLALAFAFGLAGVAGVVALADVAEKSASDQPEFKLPPGWTEADMQACIVAGTPGKMHKYLADDVGAWHGKVTMWMPHDSEPMGESECTSTIAPMMDGRYTKIEWDGEMPGMGPYHGFGINGYDNVSQEFVSIWLDNHSTGIMRGVGKLSDGGKTLTWKYTHNCPLTKKPTIMRSVETTTGPGKKSLVMFGTDPKSGKEYKMMSVELTKK